VAIRSFLLPFNNLKLRCGGHHMVSLLNVGGGDNLMGTISLHG